MGRRGRRRSGDRSRSRDGSNSSIIFAASCNAAAAVGVSENTVYAWRKQDSAFCAGWSEALAQGYARLEAELLLASSRALNPDPDERAAVRVGAIDAKTALAVLEAYRPRRISKIARAK